jgi:hypothetical protein
MTNNLDKPAPTPPITHINLKFALVDRDFVGAGFTNNI